MKFVNIVLIVIFLVPVLLYSEKQPQKDRRIIGYRKTHNRKKANGVEIKGRNYSHKEKKVEKVIPRPIPPVKIEDPTGKNTVLIESPGYNGDMKNGKKHGRGKLVLRNGDVYIGSWVEDRKTGQGIYIYSNGIKYNGQWKNDVMEGSGSFMFPGIGTYYGDVKNGQMTGYGVFKYNDGSVYEGYWKNGKWHGKGQYSLPDGRILEAVFADHQVVKILLETESDSENKEERGGKS